MTFRRKAPILWAGLGISLLCLSFFTGLAIGERELRRCIDSLPDPMPYSVHHHGLQPGADLPLPPVLP